MGRELALLLSTQGCHLALCDLDEACLTETKQLVEALAPAGTRVTTFRCDVSQEAEVLAFRDAVLAEHQTDHVNLVFNNAGIAGGGSFLRDAREQWEKTFDVCWYGVYFGSRAFLPLLIASTEGHLVNTSSVNGFWASAGLNRPHTAYAAAKFAVKGFSEALVTELRNAAPHVLVSVVMPGHIGTSILANSSNVHGRSSTAITEMSAAFRNNAPTTAEQAARTILDGIRERRWRILVGEDARVLDQMVRDTPEEAYEASFAQRLGELGVLRAILE